MKRVDASALSEFDKLPNSAYVRMPVVSALLAVSPATVWRWTRMGKLPRSIRISGVTLWNVGDLRKILSLAKSEETQPPQ